MGVNNDKHTIYSGKTPLFSDFTVIQTGPMQLTVSGGEFQTTGQSKHFEIKDVPPEFFVDGRAELDNEGRARVWFQDKVTKQPKDKSKRRTIVGNTVINIVAHPTKSKKYKIDLRSPSVVVMVVQVQSWFNEELEPATSDLTQRLVFPFVVPAGTTDLSGLDIGVFKVLPGRKPKGVPWEV